ncbi:hypothetical protein BDN70DRAFT_883959 [Pholiota conissans]|uniref:DUF6534 domain-containing protein n=1 Tax=Pholiota conissans TaxID=109636 RepID=A0A9P5YVB3_9AGAR|nr:hypothetical protein BDN70DRAFT_883959 [Pholiota conissans]
MSSPDNEPKPIFCSCFKLLGCMFNWLLMGSVIVQTFYFHLRSPKDRPAIQMLVYIVVGLDIIQTGFATHNTWWLNVLTFGEGLRPTWSASTIPGMAGLTSALVQMFYAWRIHKLSRPKSLMSGLAIMIVMMALAQFTASFVSSTAIGITDVQKWEAKITELNPAITCWLIVSFCNDILISACMIYILSGAKTSLSQISRTRKLMDKLIIHAIQTGTVTAVCAGINLLLFIKFAHAFYYIAPGMIAGKLYTISLLSTLNSRDLGEPKDIQSDRSLSMRVQVTRTMERVEDVDLESSMQHWLRPSDPTQKKENI